jgi:hypothetical protein
LNNGRLARGRPRRFPPENTTGAPEEYDAAPPARSALVAE